MVGSILAVILTFAPPPAATPIRTDRHASRAAAEETRAAREQLEYQQLLIQRQQQKDRQAMERNEQLQWDADRLRTDEQLQLNRLRQLGIY